MSWVPYSQVGAKVGDVVRYWNGYSYLETALNQFDLSMQSIDIGERVLLRDCQVFIEDGKEIDPPELDTFDSIQELVQLGEFLEYANSRKVDLDRLNHSLLDDATKEFEEAIEYAVYKFKRTVKNRIAKVTDYVQERMNDYD